MLKTVLIGAGGHAKVIIEILRESATYDPVACLSGSSNRPDRVLGVPVIGDDDRLADLRDAGIGHAFVAIGDNHLRAMLSARVEQLGFALANAISQYAVVSPSARLGRGVAVMAGAMIGADSDVHDGVIVNSSASVDHDCVLNAYCHVGPGVTLAGSVALGEQAFVATGASVIPNQTIGRHSIIGAGSVVIRDVPEFVVAFGVPARPVRDVQRRAA